MDWQQRVASFIDQHGPQLLGGAAILVAGFIVSSWVAKVFGRWLDRKPLEPPVKLLLTRVVHLLVLAMALVIALGTLGVDIAPLVAGIGVAGVGVGLALQGVLGNLVAGLVIIFTKPFRIGEYVEIIGVHGEVRVIDLFTTTLIHVDQSRVIIPNRKIVGELLHNYGNVRQLDLSVGVTYSADLRVVIQVLTDVLAQNSRVLKDPAPVVGVSAFQDSAIELAIKPWVKVSDYVPAAAEINLAVVDAFRARNIEMPFPQREVRLLNSGSAAA